MKRILAMMLCLSLLCMGAVAIAEEEGETIASNPITYPDGSMDFDDAESATVNITAIATSTSLKETPDVYSVEIVWGDMQFAYGYGAKETVAKWNPEKHIYEYFEKDSDVEAKTGWYMLNEDEDLENDGAKAIGLTTQDAVMVFNHSNQPVDVAIAIEQGSAIEALSAKFTSNATGAVNETEDTDNNTKSYELKKATESVMNNEGEYTTDNRWVDDGSCVFGQISITGMTDNVELPEDNAVTIASMTVTISKHADAEADDE